MELTKIQMTVLVVYLLGMGFCGGALYTGAYGFQEVYFLSGDGAEKQIGFQDTRFGFGSVCTISTQDQVKIADDAYMYGEMTDCHSFEGSLQQQWGNQSFPSYNVYESVQCMQRTGNRSKCVPE